MYGFRRGREIKTMNTGKRQLWESIKNEKKETNLNTAFFSLAYTKQHT
jgi:hypothetical protein